MPSWVQPAWFGFIIGAFLALAYAMVTTDATTARCVPHHAVDYNGNLNAWLDRTGAIVILANEEDSVPFCNTYKEHP